MLKRFEQFSFSIALIYKCIQKIEREEMARYGLKGPHVQCLMAMRNCGEGVTAAQLCELCEKDKAAISRTVAELERKQLLVREGASYRARLQLTEQGEKIAETVGEIVVRAVEAAGVGLTESDRQIFYASLERISSNLQQIAQQGVPQKEKIEE